MRAAQISRDVFRFSANQSGPTMLIEKRYRRDMRGTVSQMSDEIAAGELANAKRTSKRLKSIGPPQQMWMEIERWCELNQTARPEITERYRKVQQERKDALQAEDDKQERVRPTPWRPPSEFAMWLQALHDATPWWQRLT